MKIEVSNDAVQTIDDLEVGTLYVDRDGDCYYCGYVEGGDKTLLVISDESITAVWVSTLPATLKEFGPFTRFEGKITLSNN